MSEMNRRDFGVAAAMFAVGQTAMQPGPGYGVLTSSVTPPMPRMGMKLPNGTERRGVLAGLLQTGEGVSVHESRIPAGTPKGTAYTIQHSEVLVVVEGTLGFQHDGLEARAVTGSVIFVAYGTNHLVWNEGDGDARYFSVEMSGDTKKGRG